MKRIVIFLLLCALMIIPAQAEGDPNIGGGGGGMGSGSGSSFWNPSWDGVRVTVIKTDGTQVHTPIDLTNKAVSANTCHFGKYDKLYYRNTLTISPDISNIYSCINPAVPLPTIVSSSGGNNIEAVRSYFTDTGHLQEIAGYTGMSYTDLVNGQYKLLIEPIAYFTYKDVFYAMTATEAALFDVLTNRGLRYNMPSLTHKNLPLSLFLLKNDDELGLSAWTGATNSIQSNIDIINRLGVGIVSFKETATAPEPSGDYTYRTDTDVITTVAFTNNGSEINPDNPAWMVFTINGVTYSKQFICPAGGRQMVWVRWHTPSTPQTVMVNVSCTRIGMNTSIPCQIVKLQETVPPDPGYYDTSTPLNAAVPDFGSNTTATWGEWFATWHPNWVMIDGELIDLGWWDWNYETYSATLNIDYTLAPNSRVKTAYTSSNGWFMKSGYGVDAQCKVVVARSSGASSYDTTDAQNVIAVFPEFNYTTYNRLLERTGLLHGYDIWEFKANPFSYYNKRTQFVPLWFPDNTKYTVPLNVIDAWTPGGQLFATVSDYVTIDGDVLDDWHIRTLK